MRFAVILALVACGKHADAPREPAREIEVRAALPGASASDLETGLAAPLEDTLAQVDGIAAIHTRIAGDVVVITIELVPNANLDATAGHIADVILARMPQLPTGVMMPVVSKAPQRGAVMRFSLTGAASVFALRAWLDRAIASVQTVSGVGRVVICGGAAPQWQIAVDPPMLHASGKTLDDLVAILRAHAIDRTRPLPEQLADVRITDVAIVGQTGERDRCTALDHAGTNAMAVTIYPAPNADLVVLRGALETALQPLGAELPPTWTLDVLPRTRPVALGVAGIDLVASPNLLAQLGAAVTAIPGAQDGLVELGVRGPHVADVRLVPATDAAADALEHDAIRTLSQAGFTVLDRTQLVVRVAAPGFNEARTAGDAIATALDHTPNLHVTARIGDRVVPHVAVEPDRARVAAVAVDAARVSDVLRVVVGGLTIGTGSPTIVLVLRDAAPLDPARLATIYVRSANGSAIPLSELVKVTTGAEPELLLRENRMPYVDVQAIGTADAIRAAIAKLSLPLGTTTAILPAE